MRVESRNGSRVPKTEREKRRKEEECGGSGRRSGAPGIVAPAGQGAQGRQQDEANQSGSSQDPGKDDDKEQGTEGRLHKEALVECPCQVGCRLRHDDRCLSSQGGELDDRLDVLRKHQGLVIDLGEA